MEDNTIGSKTANEEDWVFSAETTHCDTVEDRKDMPTIGHWLSQFCEATQTIPKRFTITDMTGVEIAKGQAEVSE